MLFLFKYSGFAVRVASLLFQKIHIQLALPAFDFLLPAGISFYTFQALGYAIDVYRGDIYAEKNFVRYALFVSFFPQLVAGPIERSKNLLKQLAAPVKFQPEAAGDYTTASRIHKSPYRISLIPVFLYLLKSKLSR